MFSNRGQIEDLKETIKFLEMRCDSAEKRYSEYFGRAHAYVQAITDMLNSGAITEEQNRVFFEKANAWYEHWQHQ